MARWPEVTTSLHGGQEPGSSAMRIEKDGMAWTTAMLSTAHRPSTRAGSLPLPTERVANHDRAGCGVSRMSISTGNSMKCALPECKYYYVIRCIFNITHHSLDIIMLMSINLLSSACRRPGTRCATSIIRAADRNSWLEKSVRADQGGCWRGVVCPALRPAIRVFR